MSNEGRARIQELKSYCVDDTREEAVSVYDDPELHVLFEAWRRLDTNGDGAVSTLEFRTKLQYAGWSQNDIDICLGDLDGDGDGEISFSEFVAAKMQANGQGTGITGASCAFSEEAIRKHFEIFDMNGDGEIGVHELGNAFAQMKLPLGDKAAQEYLAGVDLNSDGKLSFDEFCAFARSVATVQEKKLEIGLMELELEDLNYRIRKMQSEQSKEKKAQKWEFFLRNRRDNIQKEMEQKAARVDSYMNGDGIGKHMREYLDHVREITDGSHAVAELFTRMGLDDARTVKLKLKLGGRSIDETLTHITMNSDLAAMAGAAGGSESSDWTHKALEGSQFLLGHPERDAKRNTTIVTASNSGADETKTARLMERKQMAVFLCYCYRRPHIGIPEAGFSQLVADLELTEEFNKQAGTGGGVALCFARAMKACGIRRTGESSFLPFHGFLHALKDMVPMVVKHQRAQEILRQTPSSSPRHDTNNMIHETIRRPSILTLTKALTATAEQKNADLAYTSKRMSSKIFGKWRKASTAGTTEAMGLLLSRAKSLIEDTDEARIVEKLSTNRTRAKMLHPGLVWMLKVIWAHYLGDRKYGVGIGLSAFLDCLRDFGLLKANEVGTTIATKEFAKGLWRCTTDSAIGGVGAGNVARDVTDSSTDLAQERGRGLVRHLPFGEFVAVLCRCAVRMEEREAARVVADPSRRRKGLSLFANEATANGDAEDEDVKGLRNVSQYMQAVDAVDPFPEYSTGKVKATDESNTFRRGSYFGTFSKAALEKTKHAHEGQERRGQRRRPGQRSTQKLRKKRQSPSQTACAKNKTKQVGMKRLNAAASARHVPSRPLHDSTPALVQPPATGTDYFFTTDQKLADVPLQVALPRLVPVAPLRPAAQAHRRHRKHGRSYKHLPDSTPWKREVAVSTLPSIKLKT
jgi:Ca2+-binding EF-hand superfamily protein